MSHSEEFQQSIREWMRTSMHFFMRKMHIYAKENSLSVTQINCMFKMKKHGAFQVSEVSHFFDMSKPAASQLLDKLVQRDLVMRSESKTDRRVKLHTLAPGGELFVDDFFSSINNIHKRIADSFTDEENRRNKEVLDLLSERLLEISDTSIGESKCSK